MMLLDGTAFCVTACVVFRAIFLRYFAWRGDKYKLVSVFVVALIVLYECVQER